jgi:hypothetical protein
MPQLWIYGEGPIWGSDFKHCHPRENTFKVTIYGIAQKTRFTDYTMPALQQSIKPVCMTAIEGLLFHLEFFCGIKLITKHLTKNNKKKIQGS